MKKIEIYKNDELIVSTNANDYDIESYSSSFEIKCEYEELSVTYTIPLNKGYKLVIEI